ncbi:hypothetical protein [Geodermatophilus sp. DSM 45219]|uniref:hypothetical protein n=1 Tax=Geodermatophilus sp. DSM 45219 TaxID=1881103 RepID=UPI00115FC75B|nr:hypothetical protein [Geodermatophilus sp. DSM 45219]
MDHADVLRAPLPDPTEASYRVRFSDHAIRTGSWKDLGVHPRFERARWPFPAIRHRDYFTGECQILQLDDRNPLVVTSSQAVDCGEVGHLPPDGIMDPYIFMETVLPEL